MFCGSLREIMYWSVEDDGGTKDEVTIVTVSINDSTNANTNAVNNSVANMTSGNDDEREELGEEDHSTQLIKDNEKSSDLDNGHCDPQ